MTSTAASRVDTEEAAKKVSWLELFFDLVFVFAVTRDAELLQEHERPLGLLAALVAFVPVYWTWVGTTMHANLHDVDATADRLGTMAVAGCGLLMAIALPDAYGETGLLFGLAYWAARLVLLAMVAGRRHRRAFLSFTVAAVLSGPLMVAGALCEGHARLAVWAVAALVDLAVPSVARRRLADVPFDAGHLTERFGTLVIIALGESLVQVAVGAADQPDAAHLATLAAAFVTICGLWWVYFAFGPDAIEDRLSHTPDRINLIRPVLSYGHLGLVMGIIAVSAAIGEAVAEPAHPLPAWHAALLLGGAALYLATFAFTRWRLFHTLATPRLVAATACLLLLLAAPHVAAGVCLALLAVLLVLLNLVEHRVLPTTLRGEGPRPGRQGRAQTSA